MGRKPVIGITADLMRRKDGVHIGGVQQFLNNAYLCSVLKAGGAPLILPVVEDEGIILNYLNIIDGLLLSGGPDVNPLLFGEEPHPSLGSVDPLRDSMEIILAQNAITKKMPLLAICRGIQVLNTACGGTLYQHLSPAEFCVQHAQKTTGNFAGHTVSIAKETKLAAICGTETVVNSFHHQALKDVPEKFIITARAKDGVIEAIEAKDNAEFIIGVQWHPEHMAETRADMLNLFKKFAEASEGKPWL